MNWFQACSDPSILLFKSSNDELLDISGNKTSLINVVKALGEYLTSEDSEILGKGKSAHLPIRRKIHCPVVIRCGTAFPGGRTRTS